MNFSSEFPAARTGRLPFQLVLAAVVAAQLTGAFGGPLEMPRTLFVDRSEQPDPRSLAAFELSVLEATAEADLEPGHAIGNRFLALLNVAEFRPRTFQAALASKYKIATSPGKAKDTSVVDPTDDNWLAWAVKGTADHAAQKGFDGFVLGIGSQAVSEPWQVAALEMVQVLKKRYPDKEVLLDARLNIGAEAAGIADGVLALGVHTQRGAKGEAELNSLAEAKRMTSLLRQAHAKGMRVFGVEFVPQHDHKAAKDAAARLQSMGVLPFVTTSDLCGVNLGPLEEVTRRVLVLHGWDASFVGSDAPPASSTLTARSLHAALEWLGCQVEYLNLSSDTALPEPAAYRGVVLDAGLVLSPEQQTRLAGWVVALNKKNVPLLLTGMPWTDAAPLQDVRDHLRLSGSCRLAPKLEKVGVASVDSRELVEGVKVTARAIGFLDLIAPEDARVILAARGQDALGTEHRFDHAFHATWGSVWIEPAALTAGAQIDLFRFAGEWMGRREIVPAVDTTTRDGRRVFFSHISGEGFTRPSALPGFTMCAEVMRQRILKRFYLPFTVAVCEADLRGWRPGQNPADAPRNEQLARSIYEMPNIAAASNSFSTPAHWSVGESISGPLNEHAKSARRDVQREVAGSMTYIHNKLLPAGKSVSLMLWPDFAPPTPEALSFCGSIGVQSLTRTRHGGDSVLELVSSAPQYAAGMDHSMSTEVFASTRASVTPKEQLAHFQSTVAARRTTPVAVGSSFLDAQNGEKLADLEKLLDWCVEQPLRAMPAAQYAASVRDAMQTRILRVAENHWIVLNGGQARTLRLPASCGVLDLGRSRGISGYAVHGDQIYIHTLGRPRSEIVLSREKSETPDLHLVECSAHIEFYEMASRRAIFKVHDWRPVEVVLGGFEPHGLCAYNENGRPYSATADAKGIVRLDLSHQATVTLQSLAPAAATAQN